MMQLQPLSKFLVGMLGICFLMSGFQESRAQGGAGLGRVFTPTIGTSTVINPVPPINNFPYAVSARTQVFVRPFLYITGSLDLTIDVNGWGSGVFQYPTTVDVYHNTPVFIGTIGFGNPISSSLLSTDPGIPMQIRASVAPALSSGTGYGTASYWFPWQPASQAVVPSTFRVNPLFSQGHFGFTLERQITIDPTVSPTSIPYVNQAYVTFTPSWL